MDAVLPMKQQYVVPERDGMVAGSPGAHLWLLAGWQTEPEPVIHCVLRIVQEAIERLIEARLDSSVGTAVHQAYEVLATVESQLLSLT